MTNPTLYTVARSDGEQREYNLTLAEAARAILQHDGGDYEIRRRPIGRMSVDGEGFDLWTRQQVANIPWRKTIFYSPLANDYDAAETDIFERVIAASRRADWRGLVAEEQSSYRATLERMRADYDPVDDADEIEALDVEIAEING